MSMKDVGGSARSARGTRAKGKNGAGGNGNGNGKADKADGHGNGNGAASKLAKAAAAVKAARASAPSAPASASSSGDTKTEGKRTGASPTTTMMNALGSAVPVTEWDRLSADSRYEVEHLLTHHRRALKIVRWVFQPSPRSRRRPFFRIRI